MADIPDLGNGMAAFEITQNFGELVKKLAGNKDHKGV